MYPASGTALSSKPKWPHVQDTQVPVLHHSTESSQFSPTKRKPDALLFQQKASTVLDSSSIRLGTNQ